MEYQILLLKSRSQFGISSLVESNRPLGTIPNRFDPGARETVEILDIVFERFSTSPFSVTAFFPALKRFLPASESDKGLFKIYDFMRRQIEEHEANLDEDAPPRDFMDVYLAKIRCCLA